MPELGLKVSRWLPSLAQVENDPVSSALPSCLMTNHQNLAVVPRVLGAGWRAGRVLE